MKTLDFEKEKKFKFAFANDFDYEKNYTYFKCIEKNKFKEASIYNANYLNSAIMLDNLKKKKHFNRTSNVVWICKHCGFIHIGVEAPNNCPICNQSSTSFILQASNY